MLLLRLGPERNFPGSGCCLMAGLLVHIRLEYDALSDGVDGDDARSSLVSAPARNINTAALLIITNLEDTPITFFHTCLLLSRTPVSHRMLVISLKSGKHACLELYVFLGLAVGWCVVGNLSSVGNSQPSRIWAMFGWRTVESQFR